MLTTRGGGHSDHHQFLGIASTREFSRSRTAGNPFLLLYNPFMNKRAKKRLKEAIQKENRERATTRQEQNVSPSKDPQERRGFIQKPAKKRG
jgi:hypothetical protein